MPDLWVDVDAALAEVPVNILPLLDDTDFKTIEASVAYNAAGMALKWNFVTTAGAMTQTAVTPTTGGDYDWASQGNGMYSIEIPASGGASINNDTEGFGWFSGVATGVLPWRGPTIGFRAAGLNNALIDSAYSTTRGLAGTALPDAAAEAAGGLYTRGSGAGQINQSANGQIDVNVAAMANAVITAAVIATNAIDADALAADAIAEIQAAILTDAVPFSGGDLTTAIGIIGAALDATVSSRATPAQVNAEVVDALATDTYPDIAAVPATPAALSTMLRFLYATLINGLSVDSNANELQLKNAAGTVIWKKSLSDVGGVYDESAGTAP